MRGERRLRKVSKRPVRRRGSKRTLPLVQLGLGILNTVFGAEDLEVVPLIDKMQHGDELKGKLRGSHQKRGRHRRHGLNVRRPQPFAAA
jgi:hypothetical protein